MLDKMKQHIVTDDEIAEMAAEREDLIAANARLRALNGELVQGLRLALPLIEEEHAVLVDSNTILSKSHPLAGQIDPDAREEVNRWATVLSAIRAVLAKAEQQRDKEAG